MFDSPQTHEKYKNLSKLDCPWSQENITKI